MTRQPPNSESYAFNLEHLRDAVGEDFDDDQPITDPPKPTCSHAGPCMVGWDLLGAEVCTVPTPDPYLRSNDA